jgi:hypothetical protein
LSSSKSLSCDEFERRSVVADEKLKLD